jgi:aminoglycoside phosphotransferase (APT) family kinase protein
MDLMPGKPGHFFHSSDPYEGKGTEVGRNFWRHLGTLAAQDHAALGLGGLRNGGADGRFWQRELDHWEAKLDAGEAIVEPIVRGAIRWLRRNPPPEAAKPAVSHGDYRCGNFLFVPDGGISAVLDWEMCHIGDPLEDIAWAINPMWSIDKHLPLGEGLAIWEAASGLAVDRAALDWWRLFATVKACAIWTTAEASFQDGSSREMVIALTALRANHFHRKEILDRMAERGAMG